MKFNKDINKVYLETTYRILTENFIFDLQIGKRNLFFDKWCKDQGISFWAIITAEKPFSEFQEQEVNIKLNELLKNCLESENIKYEQVLGISLINGSQAEKSFFVKNITRGIALQLGRIFQQNVIVYGRINEESKLIRCYR